MIIFHPLRRGRSNRRNPRRADLTYVVVKFKEHLKERLHAVWTREDDPIVRMRVLHELGEFAQFRWRFDPYRR